MPGTNPIMIITTLCLKYGVGAENSTIIIKL